MATKTAPGHVWEVEAFHFLPRTWAVIAHVADNGAVGCDGLENTRRLLAVHTDLMYVAALDSVMVGVRGGCSVHAVGAAKQQNGAVANVKELVAFNHAILKRRLTASRRFHLSG